MKIIFNIGLENNPMDILDIRNFLWIVGFHGFKIRTEESEYIGNPETTLIIECDWAKRKPELPELVQALCIVTDQECIALTCQYEDKVEEMLIYNPNYVGEKQDFNIEYFVNY